MTETLGEALVLIKGDLSSLSATLAQAKDTTQKTTAEMNRTLKDVGRGMTDVGKKLTMGLTTPILGAAGAAVKLSTDFSAAMANVATLIPGQAERIEALKAATSDLSAELGKTATEMADGLYQVISAFGDSADTINVLEINAKAAAAGIASVTDAVNLTSAVTKAYGDTSAEAVQNVSDLALLTVRLGQTTFSELAASIGRVTPLTKELGVSQEELFAVMATGTGVTGGAAEVSTQLRGVLQGLLAPTADMSNLLSELGYESGQAMLAEQGLHGAIQTIIRAARDTGVPLQKYISSIEGQTLALALAGPQADTYAQKLAAMEDAAGTTDAAFREQTQGVNATGFAMAQAQQKIAQVTRELGDALAPAITTILDKIDPLVGWVKNLIQHFSELDPKTQTIISAIAGLAVAIGPVLVVLGTMTQGLGGLGKMLGSTIGILSKVGGVIAGLATPIAIAVAAGAALYAAYKTNFLGIGDFVRQAIDVIKYHIERIPIYFEGVKGALGALGQVFGGVFEGIGLILQGFDVLVDAYIVAPARKMWEAILSAAQAVGNILKRMMDAIKPIVQPIADFLVKIGVGIGESLKEMFGRATSAITDTLTAAAEQAEDDFSSIEESVSPATQAFGLMAQGALKVADSLDGAGTRIREGWNQSVSEAQEKALQAAQAQRDLVDATEDTAAENEEIEKIFASLNERLDEITAQSEAFGEAFDANAAEVEAIQQALADLVARGIDPTDSRFVDLQNRLKKLTSTQEEFSAGTTGLEDILAQMQAELAQASAEVEVFGTQQELAARQAQIVEKAIKDLIARGLKPGDKQLDELIEDWKGYKAAAEDAGDQTDEITKLLNDTERELELTAIKAEVLGDEFDANERSASILQRAIETLVEHGLEPSDPAIQRLSNQLDDFRSRMNESSSSTSVMDAVMEQLNEDLNEAANRYAVWGDEQAYVQDQMGLLERAINDLIAQGIDPQDEAIQDLKARHDELALSLETTTTASTDFKTSLEESTSAADTMNSTLADMNDELWDAGQRYMAWGDGEVYVREEMNVLKGTVDDLIDQGIDPNSEAVQELVSRYDMLAETLENDTTPANVQAMERIQELANALDRAKVEAELFGDEQSYLENASRLLEQAVKDLMDLGLTPQDDVLKNLIETYNLTEEQLEELKNANKDATNSLVADSWWMADNLAQAFDKALGGIDGFSHDAAKALVDFFDSVAAGEKSFSDFGSMIKEFLLKMLSALEVEVLAQQAAGIAVAIAQAPITLGASLLQIPVILAEAAAAIAIFEGLKSVVRGLAEGGLVTGPTFALVGEAGPEMVIPLDRLSEFQIAPPIMPTVHDPAALGEADIDSGPSVPTIGAINVYASDYAGGQAAARGFVEEMTRRGWRSRGVY